MSLPDHNPDVATYSIYKMVLNRLPFIDDNENNTMLISQFTMEVMEELEPCFRVASDKGLIDPPDFTRVGKEDDYSMLQRSCIADIVAVYCLLILANTGGSGKFMTTTAPAGKVVDGVFLKKAKAGTVETDFDQFDIKKSYDSRMETSTLLSLYKKSGERRARTLGCIFDICDDCSLALSIRANLPPPFIIPGWDWGSGGCGCH